ncbi:MAG: helix-turn-helix domain-containing protein [Gemmatimonadaceae bacterium]
MTTALASQRELDRILFAGTCTAVGQFRCAVRDPRFPDSGPTQNAIVVFPRTSVWIRHARSPAFVADANVITIYNRGQEYGRRAVSPEGDRCEWFAMTDDVAIEAACAFDPSAADRPRRPFTFERAVSPPDLYFRQRALVRRLRRGLVDPLAVEDEALAIISLAIRQAYGRRPAPLSTRRAAARRRADLAEAARAELQRAPNVNRSVGELAASLSASPFHLCRVFHAVTGRTLHYYRTELRLRAALERFEGETANTTLSAIAHDLGFASHAHFSTAMRRVLGVAPSLLREALR